MSLKFLLDLHKGVNRNEQVMDLSFNWSLGKVEKVTVLIADRNINGIYINPHNMNDNFW